VSRLRSQDKLPHGVIARYLRKDTKERSLSLIAATGSERIMRLLNPSWLAHCAFLFSRPACELMRT
jgi:hypothetical protein